MCIRDSQLLQFLLDYVAKEPVERILVGFPKQMNKKKLQQLVCRHSCQSIDVYKRQGCDYEKRAFF